MGLAKKTWFILFMLSFTFCLAQDLNNTDNPKEEYYFQLKKNNFSTIKKEGQAFYNAKIERFGVKAISGEGSPYVDFQKFIRDWEGKLAKHGYNLHNYFRSLDDAKALKEFKTIDCEWEEFGPIVKSSGFSSGVNGIGPVEFIRINKSDPTKMLAGSTYGGLFFSSDSGNLWKSVSDGWLTTGVSWAEFSDAHLGTIVAVSAMGDRTSGGEKSNLIGPLGRIMISRDYGQTWNELLSTGTGNILSPWDRVNKIIFNPDNANEIFIAKSNGLYKYTDIDISNDPSKYKLVFSPSDSGNFEGVQCMDVEIVVSGDLFPNGNFFATSFRGNEFNSTNNSYSIQSRAYVTKNEWQTHQRVFEGIDMKSVTFEFSPSILEADNTDLHKVEIHSCIYTAGNRKQIWGLRLFNLTESLKNDFYEISNFGQCFAFAVNPFDSKKIIYSKGIKLGGTNNGFANTNGAPSNTGLHDDKEHFIWHPDNPNEVWVGHHGGISKSLDNGLTWESKDLNLGIAEITTFDHSENDINKISLSLEHDGNTRLYNSYDQSNLAHDWNVVNYVDGIGSTIIDDDDYQFYFSSGQYGYAKFASTSYTTDSIIDMNSSFDSSYGANFNGWFEPAGNNTVLYTPGVEGDIQFGNVYRTKLEPGIIPVTNTKISDFTQFIPGNNSFFITGINASQKRDNIIFTDGFHKTSNPDIPSDYVLFYSNEADNNDLQAVISSWKEIVMPYDDGQSINTITFGNVKESHYIKDRYYLTTLGTSDNKYQVTMLDIDSNDTINFTDITGNLPRCGKKKLHDYDIFIEKGTNEGIYVILNCGVFYLHGKNLETENYDWTLLAGLPNVVKSGIKGYYNLNKLRVSTFGRGLWEGCFVCPEELTLYESGLYSNNNVFLEARQEIHSIATIQAAQSIKYRAGDFIDLKPGFSSATNSVFDAFIHPCEPNRSNSFKGERVDPWSLLAKQSDVKNTMSKPNQDGFLLYPNPSRSVVTLYMEKYDSSINYDLTIYSYEGRKVKTLNNVLQNTKIDLSSLSSGVYIINLSDGKRIKTTRFIKN